MDAKGGPVVSKAQITPTLRGFIERWVQEGIDLLDLIDAASEEREPNGEDEIMSEDDAVLLDWREVGRQFGS